MLKSPRKALQHHASSLEITNHILDQILIHLANEKSRNAFLDTEGLYRKSGEAEKIEAYFNTIKNTYPLKLFADFTDLMEDPHVVIGVLKKALQATEFHWPIQAKPLLLAFQNIFYENSEAMDPQSLVDLIVSLSSCDVVEEAKLIHNLIHLGYLISSHGSQNKMDPFNMARLIGPALSTMTGHQIPAYTGLSVLAMHDTTIDPKLGNIATQVTDALEQAIKDSKHFESSFADPLPAQRSESHKLSASMPTPTSHGESGLRTRSISVPPSSDKNNKTLSRSPSFLGFAFAKMGLGSSIKSPVSPRGATEKVETGKKAPSKKGLVV